MEYAPIIIPTLNRYDHFKRCINSLRECEHAEKTDLYIALDYPSLETHYNGWKKINSYVEKIEGFKSINILKRSENFGVVKNFADARNFVWKFSDKFISSEDDNEFSYDFLSYMNDALEKFKDNENIFGICGYMLPINFKKNDPEYFLMSNFSAWGWGGWRHKFEKVNFSLENMKEDYLNPASRRKIKNKQVLRHMEQAIKLERAQNDTAVCNYLYQNDYYCLFPKHSKTRNFGNDGTGINCKDNMYTNKILSSYDIHNNEKKALSDVKEIIYSKSMTNKYNNFVNPYGINKIKLFFLDSIYKYFRFRNID
jgi:hypothetical protein